MSETAPFSCLGFDAAGAYHFRVNATNQHVTIKPGQLNPNRLLVLAPLDYWSRIKDRWGRVDWIKAADIVIRHCEQAGLIQIQPQKRKRSAVLDAAADYWREVLNDQELRGAELTRRKARARLRLVS